MKLLSKFSLVMVASFLSACAQSERPEQISYIESGPGYVIRHVVSEFPSQPVLLSPGQQLGDIMITSYGRGVYDVKYVPSSLGLASAAKIVFSCEGTPSTLTFPANARFGSRIVGCTERGKLSWSTSR